MLLLATRQVCNDRNSIQMMLLFKTGISVICYFCDINGPTVLKYPSECTAYIFEPSCMYYYVILTCTVEYSTLLTIVSLYRLTSDLVCGCTDVFLTATRECHLRKLFLNLLSVIRGVYPPEPMGQFPRSLPPLPVPSSLTRYGAD